MCRMSRVRRLAASATSVHHVYPASPMPLRSASCARAAHCHLHKPFLSLQQQHHRIHQASRRSFSSISLRPHLDLRSLTQPSAAQRMKQNIADRGLHVDLDAILSLHQQCGQLQYEVEQCRSERNRLTASIGHASGEERQRRIEEGKAMKERLKDMEERLEAMKERLEDEALRLPNVMQPGTPIGPEGSGRLIEHIGTKPSFSFQARDHVALAALHDLLDFPAAALTTGSRFVFLKHELSLLELALINYTMHALVQHGFIPLTPPDLVRNEFVWATGYQPRVKQGDKAGREVYGVDGGLALVGTAEIPMAGYYVNHQFTPYAAVSEAAPSAPQFPIHHCGFSHCFRVEAGGLGAQHRGLYRLHQFSKVEMFTLALPHQSTAAFDQLLAFQRSLLSALGLYARVVEIPSGDLGASASRKVDMEVWMMGSRSGSGSGATVEDGRWGEVSSASRCEDYQSRRLNIRFKDQERVDADDADEVEPAERTQQREASSDRKQSSSGKWRYVHTLNGTACAVPRLLIGIMEKKQRADGSIEVPECLRPHMMGIDVIPSPIVKRTHQTQKDFART